MAKQPAFALRVCVPVMIFALCAWMLTPYVAEQSLGGVLEQLGAVTWRAWVAAASLSALSLWFVGRYDGVAHRHFATGIPDHQARWSGTISISLAQTLGFGLFTGAMARWRMLPDITLATSLKLSTFVSFSFIASWAFVTALACVILPSPAWVKPMAFACLAISPVVLWLSFRHPKLRLGRFSIRLPSLPCSGAIVLWTALDTIAAGAVLFVLLPHGVAVSFAQFLPLFLLALGTALLSNTPGGVGPFELMMIGLFPQVAVAEILVSILAFRMVYYAVPAVFAAIALTSPFAAKQWHKPAQKFSLRNVRNAEVGIISQNGGRTLGTRDGACAIWPTGQTITALCDPIRGSVDATLAALNYEAKTQGRVALMYKCSAASASAARRFGWSVLHISDDALLNPKTYNIQSPALRRLRRKLRSVEKSGVTITWTGERPWSDMARIDAQWQMKNGAARGGTMGRFERGYLEDHFIARAYINGTLCAFASFQCSTQEWCLDVMRHDEAMPDGTMHALVHQAVLCAAQANIPQLSLAAVPACPDPNSPMFRWLARVAIKKAGGTGLRQFKSAFAPSWTPRYAAAPSRMGLTLALLDITREVHNPAPLTAVTPTIPHQIHNSDENYALASRRAS